MGSSPPWGRHCEVVPFRRFAALTRGYRKFGPHGAAGLAAVTPTARMNATAGLPPNDLNDKLMEFHKNWIH